MPQAKCIALTKGRRDLLKRDPEELMKEDQRQVRYLKLIINPPFLDVTAFAI